MTGALKSVVAAAVALLGVVAGSSPARAGGSHLTPVLDRYEAGETATLVGYTDAAQPRPQEAYRAFVEDPVGLRKIEVGRLELTDRGRRGWESVRVVLRFVVPADLPPGQYLVTYCPNTCEGHRLLGDVIGGFLSVGVDPPTRWSREWPLDEPEIANLADDSFVSGPGYWTTAGELRAGNVPHVAMPGDAERPASEASAAAPRAAVERADRPPRPPADAPAGEGWVLVWAGLGFLALAGFIAYLRLRTRVQVPPPPEDPGDPGPAISAPQSDRVAASRR